jgi:parallel beta-helix repeat protein
MVPAKLRPYAGPATLASLAVIVTFAVAGPVAVGGGRALASQVSCGDTITADTTLDTDLVNCPNHGIVIGADGITLDLNGHLVDGDGTPAADCNPRKEPCDFGVFNDGHDGVTVMHGSVREFAVGVLFGSAAGKIRDNRVLGVSSNRNQFAGLGIFSSLRSLVRNSSGDGSLDREGSGMQLGDSHHVRILNNSFRHNAHTGIVTFESSRNVIKENLFLRNGDEAILMEGGERFRVTRNRFARNGAGITLGPGSRNVITRNRVSRGRDGIRIEKGRDNLVAHNVVVAARTGIRLGIHEPFIGGAHNVVRENLVRDSRVDAFVVLKKDTNSLLVGNIAKGAGDDGFDVESRTMTLTSNRAVRNADLGIEAVFGVTDGGGNIARHNGDPRQCTHISCQ